mmetsp:Transcript_36918/g.95607  ORF Transcript_36918/g.95607 Transcript_36918/m.95607 type:complete len:682 (-) Transcript_36918:935-2980(-)
MGLTRLMEWAFFLALCFSLALSAGLTEVPSLTSKSLTALDLRLREYEEALLEATTHFFNNSAAALEKLKQLEENLEALEESEHRNSILSEVYGLHGRLQLFELVDRTEDTTVARTLLLKSTALGYGIANSVSFGRGGAHQLLGLIFSNGIDVEMNMAKGLLYLHLAAGAGNLVAMQTLGYKHLHGLGVPRSCETAQRHYLRAAEFAVAEFEEFSGRRMVEFLRLSDMEYSNKASSNVFDAQMASYYAYAGEHGDPQALFSLGQVYYKGAGEIEVDHKKALETFANAAELGERNSYCYIGTIHAEGYQGVEQNYELAASFFKKGPSNNAVCLNGLGFLYLHGHSVERNKTKAFQLFAKASELGSTEARYNLGVLYSDGEYFEKDFSKAFQYYSLASNHHHGLATYNLACMHLGGLGVPKSCQTGVTQLKRLVDRSGVVVRKTAIARALRLGGRSRASFFVLLELSEMGFEVAQSNAAYMIERKMIGEEWPSGGLSLESLALRNLERSSSQGNIVSHISVGDFYYDGRGIPGRQSTRTDIQRHDDLERATSHYRAAADNRSPRGLFNLGYMYTVGDGVTEDLHLAKRYFDMAAATKEAQHPARIALVLVAGKLLFRVVKAEIMGETDNQSLAELRSFFLGWEPPVELSTIVGITSIFVGVVLLTLRSVSRSQAAHIVQPGQNT